MTLRLKAKGTAAHGSRPWLGDNAIEHFYQDYLKIKSFFTEQSDDSWGKTICLSQIRAGESFNQVPGECEGVLDIRYTEEDRSGPAAPDTAGRHRGGTDNRAQGALAAGRRIALSGPRFWPWPRMLNLPASSTGPAMPDFMTAQGNKGNRLGAGSRQQPAHGRRARAHNRKSLQGFNGMLDNYMKEIQIAG